MNRMTLATAALVAFTPVAVAQPPGGGQGPPPAPVRVASVERQALASTTLVPGTVSSRFDARVSADVTGRLTWIADVGTRVDEGEVVARIDDTQLQLQRVEYEAGVQRELTRLAFLTREAERLESLLADNVAARSQYERVINDRDVSRSDLAIQRARLGQVSDQIERTRIKVPFSGVVAERLRQSGERVGIGDPVVRLTAPDELEVIARAPLDAVAYLSEGSEVRIERSGNASTGTVRTLVPFGDERSRLFELRITVPGDGGWQAGQAVRVAIPTSDARDVLVVSRDALILRREGIFVYRVTDAGTAERVTVTTGASEGESIEVHGDLRPGDRVVIRGGERLRPGQPVAIQQ